MAEENLIQTNIVATSDMTSLIVDLNKVSSALALLQERLNASNKSLATQAAVMNRTFAETLRSTGQFSTHFVSLTSDVDKFGSQLDRGQVKLGQFFRVYGDHVKTSGGLVRELAQQQVRLQNSILQPLGRNAEGLMQYNVQIPRGLDITKNKTAILKQEMQILNKVVQEGAGQLINWGKNTQWAGRQLTVGLTVPMAAFGKAAADAFKTADEQLIRLTKVYGGLSATSAAELAKVRKDVQETATILAKSYGASFKDTLGLAADIAATGKQGNELLGSIQETTRLAVLGEVDRADAMKATLAIQSAFKQNTEELTQSINFLNAVENQTSTTLNDLVEAIPKAGPVVKGLGGDVEDLALYLTAMREGGINASEGANALKSGLASLINPTKVATGLFAGFGIDLKNIVTSNAGNLTNTLLDLQKALDTLDPLQKQQAIEQLFGKFQFSRMNALFENLGKQGSQTLQVLDLMKASSEDLANIAGRELAQVTESASGKYKRAVEGLKADLAGIGDQFLKINTTLINVVDSVIKFVDKLPQPIKQALAFMGMLTATAGPLIMLAGVLGNFFGYIIKGVYHFKALFKGAEGWKLLTPEILAANKAGGLIEETFYSDARAAAILKQALDGLAASYAKLETRASSAAVSTNPTISTVAGSVVVAGGGARQVNTESPYLSDKDTRSFSHMEPVSQMSTERREGQTVFGVVPGAPIVNQKIGANPQIYMEEDLPKIPGLTSIKGVSTGVVSQEAAKWHSMSAALAMQSESEIALLKREVATTGLVTSSLSDSYQAMLPEMTRLTSLAASESKLIVAELQQGKITVDQARAKIIALNAQIEAMMAQTASTTAAGMGRTIDVTRVPLLDQPVVNPVSGKSNMKELMKPGRTRTLINNIARVLGVKTYGAPYSIETTMPKRLNTGGDIEKYGAGNTIVSGPSSINYDDRMGRIPVGGFVLNQQASLDPRNAPLVAAAPQTYNAGGPTIDAMLTPKETIFGPGIRKNPELYAAVAAANNGYALGGNILPMKKNYGRFASSLSKMITSGKGKDAILNYQEDIVLKAGTARASAKVIDELTGTPLPKGATYDKYGHIITKDGTRIPGKIAKPATGLLSDEESFNKYNKILSGLKGLKGKDVTGYLRGLLRFGGGRVVGSTSQLLRSIPENILDRKIVDEIEKKISSEYVRRVTRMKREGVGLTDANNPYHDISSSVLEEYFDNIPALRGIWNQWKVKTSATNKHYFNEMVKGRGASTNELIDLQVFGPNGEVIPIGPLKGADGSKLYHAANKDWEENLLGYNMGGGIIDSKRKNYGVKSLPTAVINRLTAKWKPQQQFRQPGYQYTLGNQDPLHGPLQIGRTMVPKNRQDELDWQREIVYKDDRFARNAVLQQFPIGSLEDRGKYILRQYMSGNYEPMEAKGSYEALRSLSKKYRGKLYRGILLGKTAGTRVSPIPQEIQDAIQLAQTTGDTSGLIGKEFIMRRSSWSKNSAVASYFAPGHAAPGQRSILIEADVNNRNVIPAGDMFPDVRFPAPYGQKRANWPEEEAIMGGKFKIIGFENGRLQVETVVDGARAMGGPVNSNKSYIVGEKGPELFVPKVNGSIVPNYALGGDIKSGKSAYGEQPTGLNMKRQMGMSLLSMIPGYAGFSIGQKLTGGNMMGGMAGGLAGDILGTALLNKFMFSADGATKRVSLLTRSWQLFTKLPGPVKIVGAIAAVAGSIKLINDKIMDHRRIINLAFGQTADTAKKIGDNFQFKSLADQLKEARSELKAFNDSMTIAGSADKRVNLGQLMFKAEDIKKEIQKVKKDLPELVDIFDKAQPDEVLVKAEQLKAQFIAGGMSSENATKKIYALIAASNDANLALSTVANAGFQAITDKSTATNRSLETFNELLVAGNTDQIYAAFETANISAQALETSLVGTKNAQGEIITEAQAYEEAYNRIAASASGNKEIGEATLRAFISQNKELEKILNATDTMEGAYAKLKLYALGIREDLVAMNSELAEALALVATQQAGILGSSTGPFKELVNLIAKKDAASKASAATAKKLATATKDQIQAEIDKRKENIDAIKKEAEERKNALDEELSDSDKLIAIQKAQIEYQNAIASGDFTTAAQAQLDIQSLVQEQQIELAKRAIDANAESRMAPEEARIKALEGQLKGLDGQIASANEAASKTMDNVNKLRETLSGLITFTISATADGVIDASEAGVLRGIQTSLKNLGLDKLAGSLGLQVTEYGSSMKGSPGPSDLNNIYEYGILKRGTESFTAAFNSVKEGQNLRVNVKNLNELRQAMSGGKTEAVNPVILLPGTSVQGTPDAGLNAAAAKAKSGVFNYQGKQYNKESTGTGFYGTGSEDRKFWYIQKADGGHIKHFEPGGNVRGPGTGTSDSIPAYLSNGEYVIRASAVQKYGTGTFDALNAERLYTGGIAGSATPAATSLLASVSALYPNRNRASDGMLPSLAHIMQNPRSDHNTGHAVDITNDPKNGVSGSKLFQTLRGDSRTKYLIFGGRIWNSTIDRNDGSRPYRGSNPHNSHIHVSIKSGAGSNGAVWLNAPHDMAMRSQGVSSKKSSPEGTPVLEGGTDYTVKPGDTLSAIAKASKTTVSKLLSANPKLSSLDKYMGGSRIFSGTKVTIPKFKEGGLASTNSNGLSKLQKTINLDPTLRGIKSPLGTAQRMIDTATAQLGTKEEGMSKDGIEGNNVTKYSRWLNELHKLGTDVITWCGTFINWSAAMSDVKIPNTFYTPEGVRNFGGLKQLVDVGTKLPTSKDELKFSSPYPKIEDYNVGRGFDSEEYSGNPEDIARYKADTEKWEKEVFFPEKNAKDRRVSKQANAGWKNVLKNPPKPGDILYLNWAMDPKNRYNDAVPNRVRHAALSVNVDRFKDDYGDDGFRISTIDGNIGDAVSRSSYELSRNYMETNPLVAYARPNYKPSGIGQIESAISDARSSRGSYYSDRDQTLSEIAKKLGIDTDTLAKLNSDYLPGNLVYKGSRITIPKFANGGMVSSAPHSMGMSSMGQSGGKKLNWFQKYVSGLSEHHDSLPGWASDPLGSVALLRQIAGQGRKGDAFSAAMLPLNFMGAGLGSKIGAIGKVGSIAAPSTISSTKASTTIMRNLQREALRSAEASGRLAPNMSASDQLQLSSAITSKTSDLGGALRTYWGKAYDILSKEQSESIAGLTKEDFFEKIAVMGESALKSSMSLPTEPTDFVKAANLAYMKAHGLDPSQPLSFYKAVRGLNNDDSAAGYFSLSGKFAASYLKNLNVGTGGPNRPTAGLYKVDLTADKLTSLLGMGGMDDEFTNLLHPDIIKSAGNLTRIGTGASTPWKSLKDGPVRYPHLRDFYRPSSYAGPGVLSKEVIEQIDSQGLRLTWNQIKNASRLLPNGDRALDKSSPIMTSILRNADSKGNQTFLEDLKKIEEIIGQKILIPKFANGGMVGKYAGGGIISTILSKAKSLAYKPINLLNQYMNYFKAKGMVKKGMFHGSADLGQNSDGPFSGTTKLSGDYANDPYHGMGFYGTTSKSEADMYAGGYNAPGQWGESYGSLNKIAKLPFGRYLDFTKDLKNQNYAMWKLFQSQRDKNFMGAHTKLGSIMNDAGMTGAIMPRISAGQSGDISMDMAKWIALNKPEGTVLKEVGLGFANGGMVGPKYNIPSTSTSIVNPMPMRYNNGGAVHKYDVGGLVVNAAPGQSEREIASMVVQMLDTKNMLDAAKSGGRGRT